MRVRKTHIRTARKREKGTKEIGGGISVQKGVVSGSPWPLKGRRGTNIMLMNGSGRNKQLSMRTESVMNDQERQRYESNAQHPQKTYIGSLLKRIAEHFRQHLLLSHLGLRRRHHTLLTHLNRNTYHCKNRATSAKALHHTIQVFGMMRKRPQWAQPRATMPKLPHLHFQAVMRNTKSMCIHRNRRLLMYHLTLIHHLPSLRILDRHPQSGCPILPLMKHLEYLHYHHLLILRSHHHHFHHPQQPPALHSP
jgi:hypothetical protein